MYGFYQVVEIFLSFFLCHLSLFHCLIHLRMSSFVVLWKSISYSLHNSSYGCWQVSVSLYLCISLFSFSSAHSFNWYWSSKAFCILYMKMPKMKWVSLHGKRRSSLEHILLNENEIHNPTQKMHTYTLTYINAYIHLLKGKVSMNTRKFLLHFWLVAF